MSTDSFRASDGKGAIAGAARITVIGKHFRRVHAAPILVITQLIEFCQFNQTMN
jgi:hypothetical protein